VNSGIRANLAAMTALLFLVAQAASLIHLSIVRHVACPYDGELIDADGDHTPAGSAPPATPFTGRDAGVLLLSALTPIGLHHPHCVVTFVGRERGVLDLATASGIRPLDTESGRCRAIPPPRGSGILLYLLAPKNSPPAS
jgi:hypothetical protein